MTRTHHHGHKAKRRTFGAGWRWLSQTPGWWVKLMMTKPQRRAGAVWQRNIEKSRDISDADKPPHGRKPHWYYW